MSVICSGLVRSSFLVSGQTLIMGPRQVHTDNFDHVGMRVISLQKKKKISPERYFLEGNIIMRSLPVTYTHMFNIVYVCAMMAVKHKTQVITLRTA